MRIQALRIVGTFLLVVGSNMAQAGLIGVSFGFFESASVYSLDIETGMGTLVSNSDFSRLNSATVDSAGRVLAGSGVNLISVDPVSGQAQSVFELTNRPATFGGIRGLAFSPGGELFAAVSTGFGQTGLFTIDLTTGALTRVGSDSARGIQGLAFSPDGTLFGWDVRNGLLSINPDTAITVLIGGNTRVDIQALEFGPDGTLYGGRNELYVIDVPTGNTQLIGSGGYRDLRGLAFVQVPEGSAFMGLIIGLALVMTRRRMHLLCGTPSTAP